MFFFTTKSNSNYEKTFFDFSMKSINGDLINFSDFKNKKAILLVNTASYCGFTNQYQEMQNIWDKYKNNGLLVIAVPSKTFNQEEKSLTIRRVLQAEHAEVGASIQVLPLIDPNALQEARDVEHYLVPLASG